MTYYMGRLVGPPALSPITIAKAAVKLNKGCYEKGGRFHSVIKWKGSKVELGEYGSQEECNAVCDRELGKRKILAREPSPIGHARATIGNTRKVNVNIRGKVEYIGTFSNKIEARKVYLEAYNSESVRLLEEYSKESVIILGRFKTKQ